MKTILLTGATGFLGSHLLETFVSQGYHVVILKRSISNTWRIAHLLNKIDSYDIDKVDLKTVFNELKIDVIINTVCSYGRKNESLIDIVNSNLIFGLHLLEEGIKNKVKTFINADSLLPRDINDYSLSKAQFVDWLYRYSNQIQVINFKIEHMYGPKDDANKFLPWLINEMVKGEGDINLTSGIQKRDFIYIDDIVMAFDLILKQKNALPQWNEFDVGTNSLIEVKNVVLSIAEKIQNLKKLQILPRLKFGVIPYRTNDVLEPNLDNSKLLSLGWQYKVSLDEGLNIYIDSIIKNRKD